MAAPNNPGPVTTVMDLGFKSDPNVHRAQKWPISSADRSRATVGGAGQDFWRAWKRREAILCSVDHNREIPWRVKAEWKWERRFCWGGWIPQSETPPLRNEAPLNCVSLRSALDYEVAWRAVKGQDERSLRDALDSSPSYHPTIAPTSERKLRRAATSALTFMTFS